MGSTMGQNQRMMVELHPQNLDVESGRRETKDVDVHLAESDTHFPPNGHQHIVQVSLGILKQKNSQAELLVL